MVYGFIKLVTFYKLFFNLFETVLERLMNVLKSFSFTETMGMTIKNEMGQNYGLF